MKALVIYDSSYGNTAAIAQAVAEGLGDDARTAAFLKSIPAEALQGTRVAAFDTRMAPEDQGFGLRFVMRVIGYAAPRIAATLKAKGGNLVAPAEGFIVEDKEGPLKAGELERARTWAMSLTGVEARG